MNKVNKMINLTNNHNSNNQNKRKSYHQKNTPTSNTFPKTSAIQ